MTNYLLDAQESIVFRNTFASGGSTSLNLANSEGDRKVGNDGVLSLAATV